MDLPVYLKTSGTWYVRFKKFLSVLSLLEWLQNRIRYPSALPTSCVRLLDMLAREHNPRLHLKIPCGDPIVPNTEPLQPQTISVVGRIVQIHAFDLEFTDIAPIRLAVAPLRLEDVLGWHQMLRISGKTGKEKGFPLTVQFAEDQESTPVSHTFCRYESADVSTSVQ